MAKGQQVIPRSAWVQAVAEVLPQPDNDPNVLTTAEVGEVFGVSLQAARARAEMLVQAGKAEKVSKRIRMSNGQIKSVPAYKLKKT